MAAEWEKPRWLVDCFGGYLRIKTSQPRQIVPAVSALAFRPPHKPDVTKSDVRKDEQQQRQVKLIRDA